MMEMWLTYWHFTWTWIMIPGFVVETVMGLYSMFRSLRFNYHYFIKYGEFVIFPPDRSSESRSRGIELAREKDWDTSDDGAWVWALLEVFTLYLIGSAIAFLWPITVITVVPMLIVWAVVRHKRKKVVFIEKLQGSQKQNR